MRSIITEIQQKNNHQILIQERSQKWFYLILTLIFGVSYTIFASAL